MPASVPEIDSGTVTAAARVGISRRMKTSTTISTRTMVISRVYCTSLTLARIVVVRSEITETWIPGGSQRMRVGSRARTPSAVWMTLAPASLAIVRRMAGCLPSQAASRVFAVPLMTLATSEMRRIAPLAVFSTRGAYCAACDIWPLMPMVSARLGPWKPPRGFQHVGSAYGGVDVLSRQAGGGEAHGIEANAHGGLFRAVHRDLGHAGRLRQALPQDGVGGVVDLRL